MQMPLHCNLFYYDHSKVASTMNVVYACDREGERGRERHRDQDGEEQGVGMGEKVPHCMRHL